MFHFFGGVMECWRNGVMEILDQHSTSALFHYSITPLLHCSSSQFLRDLFELITLDNIADLVFAKIAQLDSALQTGAHFLHVVLKAPQRGESAVIYRLAPPQNTCSRRTRNPAIRDQAAGHDPLAQLEHLFDLGVTDNGFAVLGIEQAGHRFFNLVKQLIDDAVKLNLYAFALGRRYSHVFNFDVEADDHGV